MEGARFNETPLWRDLPKCSVDEFEQDLVMPLNRRPRKRVYRRLNYCFIPGYAPICLDANDPETVAAAFKYRLFREPPEADLRLLQELRIFVMGFVRQHLPVVRPYEFHEWLAKTTYNEASKLKLVDAFNSLRGGRPTRHTCQRYSSFVKTEFYTEWKNARIINGPTDEFKAWSGPKFRAIEDAVYCLPEFIKHTPVPDRPGLIRGMVRPGVRYYQTDFTAFESHFLPAILSVCECELYRYCLSDDNDSDFLCSIIEGEHRMRTRSGVRVVSKGRRMSGDMCTSLGNGFTNLMLAKFLVHKLGGKIHGYVEGDDGLFASTVELTTESYASLGFKIKIDEVVHPCEASFCGMVFAESGQIIREPRKFLMGFGWTSSFINAGPRIMDELLRAKALSAVYETPHCPIVGAIARYALKMTPHANPRFIDDGYHVPPDMVDIPDFNPAADTRDLFARLFRIPPPVQLLAEGYANAGLFDRIAELIPPSAVQAAFARDYVIIT